RQESGFVASVIGLPECVVEGATKEEAVANARDALAQHLSQGEVVSVEVENIAHTQPDNPWLKISGMFADDPTWDDFLASMEEYRRELDAEEAAREVVERLEAA
ncbi:MAG: type II toxin-antitoxin system HicB family antitoxin, partial [Blastocatellia bacterium]